MAGTAQQGNGGARGIRADRFEARSANGNVTREKIRRRLDVFWVRRDGPWLHWGFEVFGRRYQSLRLRSCGE